MLLSFPENRYFFHIIQPNSTVNHPKQNNNAKSSNHIFPTNNPLCIQQCISLRPFLRSLQLLLRKPCNIHDANNRQNAQQYKQQHIHRTQIMAFNTSVIWNAIKLVCWVHQIVLCIIPQIGSHRWTSNRSFLRSRWPRDRKPTHLHPFHSDTEYYY